MESIDKGLKVCTKMGADKLFENAPKIYLPKLSAQVQKFGILMKKGLHWVSVVRVFPQLESVFVRFI